MDLSPLREIAHTHGPFASVYFDASHDTEDAAHAVELRWAQARRRLSEQDTDQETLRSLDNAMQLAVPAVGRACRALIAAGGRVLVDRLLLDPPAQPIARYGPLPYLLPLVSHSQPSVAHVVVVVNHIGADLRGYDSSGQLVEEPTVDGKDHPVHKVPGGGWSHRRMQQRTEETWQHNAGEVAAEVERLARHIDTKLIVIAGEVQSRAALRAALSEHYASIAMEVGTGGRAEGTDEEKLNEAIHRLIAKYVKTEQRQVLEEFRAELGRHEGRAVQGLHDVATALREAAADTVILDEPATTDRTMWIGSEPTQLATEESELRALGVPHLTRERADAALLRALAATGAQLQLTTGEPRLADGVGALLRYPRGQLAGRQS